MFATAQKANAKPSNSSLFQGDKGSDAFIQPKLNIGKPGDAYEIEADRVADTVVARGNEQPNPFFSPSPSVQRQSQEEDIQEKQTEDKKEASQIQQKPLAETITPLVQRQPEEEQLQEKENTEGEIQKKGLLEDRVQENAMTTLAPPIQKQEEEVQEKDEENEEDEALQPKSEWIQRKDIGTPVITDSVESRIQRASSNGKPLDKNVKHNMESGFGADFSGVRVHTDQESSSLNSQLSARAFTHKNNIFFGKDQYQPETDSGKHLLAHELTHTVQQGASVQRKPEIATQSSTPKIQRLGISDALDYFADKAYLIPGFRMFTILIGINPINMSGVDRSAANIMRAIVEFLPGGNLITRVLDKYNVFTDAANLMKDTLDTLSLTGQSIKNSIDSFLDSLGWSDIFDLGGVWERAKRIFTTPINSIIKLGKTVLTSIYELVRKAILAPLAQLAQGTRGWDLLKALLGKDPITGEAYPTTAETVIGGFMKLIGQEEVWENIVKGNAVGRAWAWFKGAISGLMAFVFSIPTTIINTIKSLTWEDIIILPKAYLKVGKAFVNIATTYISWGLSTVIGLLEILFSVVAPGVLPYIKKAKGAFTQILKNPVGFIGNLIKAVKNGFQKFAANILEHLKKSLLNWLLGSLAGAGIYIPQGLNFKEIIKFVASVLGLTWENLRLKLVKHLGEPAVKALETGFELVKLLVTEGPAAAWDKIMEHLGNLKQMVIQEITQFVVVQVVKKAIAKLILSLNPAGAVIQAIITIYDTITFLIEKIKQIAQVGMAVIDSISAIAAGVLTQAADKVEQTLAGMLTLAINFLAKFAGLGKISEAIIRIIQKIREPIDKAMDKVVGWIVSTAKNFLIKGKEKVKGLIEGFVDWLGFKKTFKTADNKEHKLYVQGEGGEAELWVKSTPQKVQDILNNHPDQNNPALQEAKNHFDDFYASAPALALLDTQYETAAGADQKILQGKIKEHITNITETVTKLANALKSLGISGDIEETVLTNVSPNSGKLLTSKNAKPLTALPGNTNGNPNAASAGDIPGWPYLQSVKDSGVDPNIKDKYVRFHIIHDQMHGPADDTNLVAATKDANNEYYRDMEIHVLRKLYAPGTIMWLEVTLGYHSTYPEFLEQAVANWGYMKLDATTNEPDKDTSKTEGNITVRSDAPPSVAGPVTIKLHGKGKPQLKSAPISLPPSTAERLAEALKANKSLSVYDAIDQYYIPSRMFTATSSPKPFNTYKLQDKKAIADLVRRNPNVSLDPI